MGQAHLRREGAGQPAHAGEQTDPRPRHLPPRCPNTIEARSHHLKRRPEHVTGARWIHILDNPAAVVIDETVNNCAFMLTYVNQIVFWPLYETGKVPGPDGQENVYGVGKTVRTTLLTTARLPMLTPVLCRADGSRSRALARMC